MCCPHGQPSLSSSLSKQFDGSKQFDCSEPFDCLEPFDCSEPFDGSKAFDGYLKSIHRKEISHSLQFFHPLPNRSAAKSYAPFYLCPPLPESFRGEIPRSPPRCSKAKSYDRFEGVPIVGGLMRPSPLSPVTQSSHPSPAAPSHPRATPGPAAASKERAAPPPFAEHAPPTPPVHRPVAHRRGRSEGRWRPPAQ